MKESDFDTAAKALDRLARRAREGLHVAASLDDKVRMSRLENALGKIRHDFIKLVYDIEDAETWAKQAQRCDKCNGLI